MTATTALGEVLREADGVRLRFERAFTTDIDDLWSAITDPERCARWLGRWSGDPTSGTVSFAMTAEDDAAPEPVSIDACEPPRRLAVTFATGDGPWPLEVTLTERGEVTELVFVHHLAEPYDASSVGPGWQYYLDRLAAVVTGAAVPEDFEQYHPALADAYPVPAVASGRTAR